MTTTYDTAAALAVAAATQAAALLPSVEPLTPGQAQPGTERLSDGFAGAVVASLEGPGRGRIGVLVGDELVATLAGSPLGGLDLAAVAQPALDAIASLLGSTAQAATVPAPADVVGVLNGPFTVVPLVGTTVSAAIVISDAALAMGLVSTEHHSPDGPFSPTVSASSADSPPPAAPAPLASTADAASIRGIEMLHGVIMDVTVELGRTRMSVRDLLALSPGTVLELDRAAGSPADLLVNGRLIARGEVVVVDEDFGLRVTEILEDVTAG